MVASVPPVVSICDDGQPPMAGARLVWRDGASGGRGPKVRRRRRLPAEFGPDLKGPMLSGAGSQLAKLLLLIARQLVLDSHQETDLRPFDLTLECELLV